MSTIEKAAARLVAKAKPIVPSVEVSLEEVAHSPPVADITETNFHEDINLDDKKVNESSGFAEENRS